MKKLKRLSVLFVATLISVLCVCGVACGNDEPQKDDGGNKPVAVHFLNVKSKELTIGDEYKLYVTKAEYLDKEINWSSSDEGVIVVKDGLCVAENIGDATVTATTEDGTSCKVVLSVGSGGMIPTLETEVNVGETLTVKVGEKFNLAAYVLFNGKKFIDGSIEYRISDEGVCAVAADGLLIAIKEGSATIVVKGSWRGFDDTFLVKTFTLDVIK